MEKSVAREEPFTEICYSGHNSVISEIYMDGVDHPLITGEHNSGLAKGRMSSKKEIFTVSTEVPICSKTWPDVRNAVDDIFALWDEFEKMKDSVAKEVLNR